MLKHLITVSYEPFVKICTSLTLTIFFSLVKLWQKNLVFLLTLNNHFSIISSPSKLKYFLCLALLRNCSSFNDPFTSKCLSASIFRSHLEYASILSGTQMLLVFPIASKPFMTDFFHLLALKFIIAKTPRSDYDYIRTFFNLNSLKDLVGKILILLKKKKIIKL